MIAPPSTTAPFAVYSRKATKPEFHFMGDIPQAVLVIFSFTVFDKTYAGAKELSSVIKNTTPYIVGFSDGADILRVAVTAESDTLVTSDSGELIPFYGIELTIELRISTER